jgi:hypothetical protein
MHVEIVLIWLRTSPNDILLNTVWDFRFHESGFFSVTVGLRGMTFNVNET